MGYYGTEASSLGSEYPCKRQRSVAYCVERTLSTLVGIVRFKAEYLLVFFPIKAGTYRHSCESVLRAILLFYIEQFLRFGSELLSRI
jgi:hypothetical protein